MPDSVLGFGDVVDLRPVPVDDDGNLFVSPVIHDWNIVTQRGIDTVVDLEGGTGCRCSHGAERVPLSVFFYLR